MIFFSRRFQLQPGPHRTTSQNKLMVFMGPFLEGSETYRAWTMKEGGLPGNGPLCILHRSHPQRPWLWSVRTRGKNQWHMKIYKNVLTLSVISWSSPERLLRSLQDCTKGCVTRKYGRICRTVSVAAEVSWYPGIQSQNLFPHRVIRKQ